MQLDPKVTGKATQPNPAGCRSHTQPHGPMTQWVLVPVATGQPSSQPTGTEPFSHSRAACAWDPAIANTMLAATGLCQLGGAAAVKRPEDRAGPTQLREHGMGGQTHSFASSSKGPTKRRRLCIHGRRPNVCRDCGGSSICEHGRRRSACRECAYSNICSHGKRRSLCQVYDGGQIYAHTPSVMATVVQHGSWWCNGELGNLDCHSGEFAKRGIVQVHTTPLVMSKAKD